VSFLRRRLVTAALTANALRPPATGLRGGLASFVLGWPTGELAPQLLALTAADTAVHLARRGRPRSLARVAIAVRSRAPQWVG